jgi:hypothetical protein
MRTRMIRRRNPAPLEDVGTDILGFFEHLPVVGGLVSGAADLFTGGRDPYKAAQAAQQQQIRALQQGLQQQRRTVGAIAGQSGAPSVQSLLNAVGGQAVTQRGARLSSAQAGALDRLAAQQQAHADSLATASGPLGQQLAQVLGLVQARQTQVAATAEHRALVADAAWRRAVAAKLARIEAMTGARGGLRRY